LDEKIFFHAFVFMEISFILCIQHVTNSVFFWVHFKMHFFKTLIERTFCRTSRYLDGKEKPRKTKDKGDNKRKRKEKTRESEKLSYKKEKKIKIRKEKKIWKENLWIHFKMDF